MWTSHNCDTTWLFIALCISFHSCLFIDKHCNFLTASPVTRSICDSYHFLIVNDLCKSVTIVTWVENGNILHVKYWQLFLYYSFISSTLVTLLLLKLLPRNAACTDTVQRSYGIYCSCAVISANIVAESCLVISERCLESWTAAFAARVVETPDTDMLKMFWLASGNAWSPSVHYSSCRRICADHDNSTQIPLPFWRWQCGISGGDCRK